MSEILTREEYERKFARAREYGGTGLDDVFPVLLAHDTALRAEVEWLRLERGTTVAITVALREELDKRDEGVRFWQSGCDTANEARAAAEARAEKAERERHAFMEERDDYVDGWAEQKARAENLAAALREIVDEHPAFYEGLPEFTLRIKRIAARALAENGE